MSDGDNKNDLTRIEDLSEFLHQGDDELDKVLSEIEAEDDSSEDQDETEVELSSFDYETPSNDNDESEVEEHVDQDFSSEYASDSDEFSYEEGPQENFLEDNDEGFENNFDENLEDDSEQLEDSEEQPTDHFQENLDNNHEENHEDNFDDNFENDFQDDSDNNFEADFDEDPQDDDQEDLEDEEEIELSEGTIESEYIENEELEDEVENEDLAQDIQLPEELPEQQPVEEAPLPDLSAKIKEDLSDVKDFAQNSTYGKTSIGGNPPFSILLQGINSSEFEDSILATLNEFGLLEGNEDLYRKSLESGQLLIAQLGEFSAIVLAGKLRRYCRNIKVALAHEIHKSESYDHTDQRGLTGPRSILQNKTKKFVRKDFNVEDIVLSTAPFIPGFKVVHSLGPMQINEQIDRSEFDDFTSINLVDYFADVIREEAFNKGANAVTSIHFNIGQKEINGTNYNIIMAHGDFVYLQANE